MKKILTIVSAFLLPTVSFAQNYSYRMMNNNFGSNDSILSIFLIMLIPLIWICFIICVIVFWIIMLIDAIKNAPEKTKLIWVIVIVFTHIIGALIYYFVEKRPKNKAKIHHTEHATKE
jgi:cytochrome bd-type quinol oxidase subunit 2